MSTPNSYLTFDGVESAIDLKQIIKTIKTDKLLCSPMNRALQTCYFSLPVMQHDRVVIEPNLIERIGKHRDVWDEKSNLGILYPTFNFQYMRDTILPYPDWRMSFKERCKLQKIRETKDDFNSRVDLIMNNILKSGDTSILIYGHGDFFSRFIDFATGCNYYLNNCEIVKIDFDES
ncbi:hypothetical protein HOK76_06930 [archaeon]|nr:hypothetical protein [archaeon]